MPPAMPSAILPLLVLGLWVGGASGQSLEAATLNVSTMQIMLGSRWYGSGYRPATGNPLYVMKPIQE